MKEWEFERLKAIRQRLLDITHGCDPTMHEPDQQGVELFVVFGNSLDNAFGESRTSGECVICLTNGDASEDFNLADLLALARMAKVRE